MSIVPVSGWGCANCKGVLVTECNNTPEGNPAVHHRKSLTHAVLALTGAAFWWTAEEAHFG